MTLALSSDQLSDMQGDIGINNTETVFTDTELDRLYNRANGDYFLAVILAFDQLLADSAKFTNYTEGQTSEDRSDRFKQIMQLVDYKREQWRGMNQATSVHVHPVPVRSKDRPLDRYYRWPPPLGRNTDEQ